VGFVISFILLAGESLIGVFIIKTDWTFLWIFAMPMIYFLMQCILRIKLENRRYWYIRKISTMAYVLQYVVIVVCYDILKTLNILSFWYSNILLFLCVAMIDLMFSYFFIRLSEKKEFGFLKSVY